MQENDQSAVLAVLAGDKDAYGALVRAHSTTVFRVAFRILGNAADAEEIVQEAFLRGYQRLESFQHRAGFGTWIYRIAVNCALGRLRRSGPDLRCLPVEESDPGQNAVEGSAGHADPQRLLLSHEIGTALQVAMRRLTPMEKAAFVLRHHEGRSMSEVGEIMGITANVAKQAVFRAVQKLRRALAPLREQA